MRANEVLFGTAIVVLSVAVNLIHTASHYGQQVVTLPAWQLAYIVVVIYVAPVVAAILLRTRRRLTGAWLLAASMAGSFVFGLVYHFLVPGPDNVFTLHHGAWVTTFQVSAVLLAVLQLTGCLVGVWAAMRLSSPSAVEFPDPPRGSARDHR